MTLSWKEPYKRSISPFIKPPFYSDVEHRRCALPSHTLHTIDPPQEGVCSHGFA